MRDWLWRLGVRHGDRLAAATGVAVPLILYSVSYLAGCDTSDAFGQVERQTTPHVANTPPPHHHHHDHHHEHEHEHDHTQLHPFSDPNAACVCPSDAPEAPKLAHSEALGVWCGKCNVGHLAGVRIESALLFETLDPHGHEIDLKSLTCERCIAASANDGCCEACGMGFVKQQAYFTSLTWALARGKPQLADEVKCGACRSLLGHAGWCDRCSRGIVGTVTIANRAVFDVAAREFWNLHGAIKRVAACELCACAMVVHRTCPNCQISYSLSPPQSKFIIEQRGENSNIADDKPLSERTKKDQQP